jgi:perosamine synthetase
VNEKLAVDGGTPVRSVLLPYGRHTIEREDVDAVVATLTSGWLTTGPKVREFEDAFARAVRATFAVTFSSGTAALHGAVFAAGLGPGDRAVTSPLTFCASANVVLYRGAEPVFADVSPDTLNLDPARTRSLLDERTKAIIAVDFAGHPAELAALLAEARERGIVLIEDAAHALGAEYEHRRVGGISPLTAFSFHPVKHVTTGEGGMVTTDDPELAARLRTFRNHGISSDARERQQKGEWFYEMVALGFNYRLPDIGCALGLSQLSRLEKNIARREAVAQRYAEAFADLPEVQPPAVRANMRSAWHLYPIRLHLERLSAGRAQVLKALRAEGIGAAVHYIPVHYHPYYRERFGEQKGRCPVAESAYERLISLPMFAAMTTRDVEEVVAAVRKVIVHYRR